MIAADPAVKAMSSKETSPQLQLFPDAVPAAPPTPIPAAGVPPARPASPVAPPSEERPAPGRGARRVSLEDRLEMEAAEQALTELLNPEQAALAPRLRAALDGRLGKLTLTDNRSTIVSARDNGAGKLDVRIQRCFAAAPDETVAAVAEFLSSDKGSPARQRALAEIRAYFQRHRPPRSLIRRRPQRIVLRPVGQTLDLRQVRDEVNRRYFDGELEVHITWGRRPSRRRRPRRNYSVRLGTYSDRDRVVRIHRCLDRPRVPRYVVASVVYHEMLHAAVPPVERNGRRHVHTPEFRRRERLFADYERAERWLERNLKRLL